MVVKKSTTTKTKASNTTGNKKPKTVKARKIAKPTYKHFRLQPRIKNPQSPLPGAYSIMKGNLKHLLKFKRLFIGISIIYFLASIVLVSGLVGATDYTAIKESISELVSGVGGQISTGVTLFGVLLTGGSGATISETGSLYQSVLLAIVSLVTIWALRQTYAKTKVTAKESYYKSMTPLIPFVLVLVVIGIQLIPLLAGTTIYGIVISQGIAVTAIEKLLWVMFVFGLTVLTIYMVCSSIFALYIVTLPDVTPMQALRSARELVRYRRWAVIRKVLFLPFSLLILGAVIMIPILLYLTIIAQWIFILLGMIAVVVSHGYMYRLYRELL